MSVSARFLCVAAPDTLTQNNDSYSLAACAKAGPEGKAPPPRWPTSCVQLAGSDRPYVLSRGGHGEKKRNKRALNRVTGPLPAWLVNDDEKKRVMKGILKLVHGKIRAAASLGTHPHVSMNVSHWMFSLERSRSLKRGKETQS